MIHIFKRLRKFCSWLKRNVPINNDFGCVSSKSIIYSPFCVDCPQNLYIEDFVKIKNGAVIINSPNEKVTIKKYTVIAANLTAVTNTHVKTVTIPQFLLDSSHINDKSSDLIIGEDVWVGANVTLLCGANLGRGCVVGANSVVSKPVPPYALVVGSPARIIKSVFTIEEIIEHEKAIYPENERMKRQELEDLFEMHYKNLKTFGIRSSLTQEELERLNAWKTSWGYTDPK